MKSFTLITSLLAAAASAVDIHLEFAGGCSTGGGGYVCTAYNPNTCCSVNAGVYFASGSFRAIPGNWNLQVRGHAGPNCGAVRDQQDSAGRDYVCLGNGPFGGFGYGFNNKNMMRGATDVRAVDGEEEAAGCATPDIMYLADGTQYNYTAIVEAQLPVEELYELGKAGASAAEIPESFGTFKLVE